MLFSGNLVVQIIKDFQISGNLPSKNDGIILIYNETEEQRNKIDQIIPSLILT